MMISYKKVLIVNQQLLANYRCDICNYEDLSPVSFSPKEIQLWNYVIDANT